MLFINSYLDERHKQKALKGCKAVPVSFLLPLIRNQHWKVYELMTKCALPYSIDQLNTHRWHTSNLFCFYFFVQNFWLSFCFVVRFFWIYFEADFIISLCDRWISIEIRMMDEMINQESVKASKRITACDCGSPSGNPRIDCLQVLIVGLSWHSACWSATPQPYLFYFVA